MGDQFLIDLKKRKEKKIGKGSLPGPSKPSGFGAGPSGSGVGGSLASPDRKRPHKASFDKGKGKQLQSGGGNKKPFRPSHTFWNYTDPKTQSFWVRDMDIDKLRSMKGKCLQCDTSAHLLPSCPRREEAYNNKQFYAYNRPKPKQ